MRLTKLDLSRSPGPGCKPGIKVWWITRPGKKSRDMVVAFGNLVILNPINIEWPECVEPHRRPGWGETSVRIVWHMRLNRAIYQDGCRVPNLAPLFDLDRAGMTEVRRTRVKTDEAVWFSCLEGRDGAWVENQTISRIEAAIDLKVSQVEARLMSEVVLFYAPGLRAVATPYNKRSIS